jgi:hypothetical protein
MEDILINSCKVLTGIIKSSSKLFELISLRVRVRRFPSVATISRILFAIFIQTPPKTLAASCWAAEKTVCLTPLMNVFFSTSKVFSPSTTKEFLNNSTYSVAAIPMSSNFVLPQEIVLT